jgi:hypothetical protein
MGYSYHCDLYPHHVDDITLEFRGHEDFSSFVCPLLTYKFSLDNRRPQIC